MSETHHGPSAGFVDPELFKGILARAARSYGQILGGAGLVQGVLASSWAWTGPLVAGILTAVGVVAILAGLLLWGRNNMSTLRGTVGISRLFLIGSVVLWLLTAIFSRVTEAGIWWFLAAGLVLLGAVSAWLAYRKAGEIEHQAAPADARY